MKAIPITHGDGEIRLTEKGPLTGDAHPRDVEPTEAWPSIHAALLRLHEEAAEARQLPGPKLRAAVKRVIKDAPVADVGDLAGLVVDIADAADDWIEPPGWVAVETFPELWEASGRGVCALRDAIQVMGETMSGQEWADLAQPSADVPGLVEVQALSAVAPQTYGEAVDLYPWLAELPSHEWDNRTTPENAAWLVGELRRRLVLEARPDADLEVVAREVQESLFREGAHLVSLIGDKTEAVTWGQAGARIAVLEVLRRYFDDGPRAVEEQRPPTWAEAEGEKERLGAADDWREKWEAACMDLNEVRGQAEDWKKRALNAEEAVRLIGQGVIRNHVGAVPDERVSADPLDQARLCLRELRKNLSSLTGEALNPEQALWSAHDALSNVLDHLTGGG